MNHQQVVSDSGNLKPKSDVFLWLQLLKRQGFVFVVFNNNK